MFRSREKAPSLLFDFKGPSREPFHSMFVFFPFIAIWFYGEKIIDLKIVKPFKHWIRPEKPFTKILEIPINKKYCREIEMIVGKRNI